MSLRERFLQLLRLAFVTFILLSAAFLSAITAMRFAIRGQETQVPKLTGQTIREATEFAAASHLELKIEEERFASDIPAGRIVRQAPPPGTRVKVRQRVRVVVSLGAKKVPIPDVVGESLRGAQITLLKQGLELGDVARAHVPAIEADQIAVQQPPATGEAASPRVNLLVSLGPPVPAYVMPDLIGKNLTAAEATLREMGAKVGRVTPVVNPALPKDTVLRHWPGPGERITAGSAVDFQIARPSGG